MLSIGLLLCVSALMIPCYCLLVKQVRVRQTIITGLARLVVSVRLKVVVVVGRLPCREVTRLCMARQWVRLRFLVAGLILVRVVLVWLIVLLCSSILVIDRQLTLGPPSLRVMGVVRVSVSVRVMRAEGACWATV